MSLDNLHNEVFTICDDDFGIAISLTTLHRALEREIKQLVGTSFISGLPTSFAGLEASVNINAAKVNISLNAAKARLDVDAEFEVIIHLPGEINAFLGRYQLKFIDGTARLLEDNRIGGQLGIKLESQGIYSMKPGPRPAEFSDRLIAQGIVDAEGNADVASYDRFEAAAFLFNPDEYLDALLSSIPVPEVRESLKTIKLLSPLKIDFIGTHVIIHSPNVEFDDPACTRIPFQKSEVAFERVTGPDGLTTTEVKINNGAAQATANPVLDNKQLAAQKKGSLNAALLFFYPKRVLVDWSFGALKPSITMSDRGSKFGIYWFYNLSAALKRLVITFTAISTTQGVIIVDAPVEVNGNSGAGIKIGCVKHEVLSVRCNGKVEPFVIEIEGGVSSNQGDLYINGKIKHMLVDIDWKTSYGFPFDQIADWILDRILNKEVRKIVGREVNLYRRNISLLSDVLLDNNLYVTSVDSNAQSESILYSVNLTEG